MSKVAIVGDPSGTGTFTISAPNGNTDRTLVLPDEAGTVLTSASNVAQKGVPAFSVYQSSAQSIPSATNTKLQFQTKVFDYGAFFDNTTNYRFQPTVAGVYQFNGGVQTNGGAIYIQIELFKNGAKAGVGSVANTGYESVVSHLIYLNGSTDYVELYTYGGAAYTSQQGLHTTYFSGALMRAD